MDRPPLLSFPGPVRGTGWLVAIAVLHFVATWLNATTSFYPLPAGVWLPAAIALAGFYRVGLAAVLPVAVSAWLFLHWRHPELAPALQLFQPLLAAGEAALVWLVLRRWVPDTPRFARGRDVFRFVLVVLGGCLLASGLMRLTGTDGPLSPGDASLWASGWLAEALAMIGFAPALIVLLRPPRERLAAMGTGLFVLTAVSAGLATLVLWMHVWNPVAAYLLLGLGAWGGLRYSLREVSLLNALMTTLTLAATGAHPHAPEVLLELQVFLLTYVLTCLLISALAEALRQRNGQLRLALDRASSRASAALASSQQSDLLLMRAFMLIPSVLTITRLSDGLLVECNDRFTEAFGHARAEAIGRTSFELGLWHDLADRDRMLASLSERDVGEIECRMRHRSGRVWRALVACTAIELDGARHAISIITDIDQRARLEARTRENEARIRLALDGAGIGYFDLDLERKILRYNNAFGRFYQLPPGDELCPASVERIWRHVHADDLPLLKKRVAGLLASGQAGGYTHEYRLRDEDGWRWVMFSARPVRMGTDGSVLRLTGASIDITAMKQADRQMRLAAEVLAHSPDSVLVCDPDGLVAQANRAFEQTLGLCAADVVGQPVAALYVNDPGMPACRGALAALGERWDGEVRFGRIDGRAVEFWQKTSPILDADGRLLYTLLTLEDLTEKHEVERRIRYLAEHDPLTGLVNRATLTARLEQALALARRQGGCLALMFLDLDRFKQINDTLGHDAGDALLKQVAQRLGACVRASDTVARMGGDEFVILLPRLSSAEDAASVADKILAALREPVMLANQSVVSLPSIGISVYPQDSEDAAELLRYADTAMYYVKSHGRGDYRFFALSMQEEAATRRHCEAGLKRALEQSEFELYYQPQLSIASGEVVAVEALLRWHDPARGLLRPRQFLDVAEESRLIVPIGEWVILEACRQNRRWQDAGLPQLPVTVNLSARQFADARLVDSLRAALVESGLAPCWLELEVTEPALQLEAVHLAERIAELRGLGLTIALDAFGVGQSNLARLADLAFDKIKIDPSVIATLAERDDAIVAAIIALAGKLGSTVVAESVETARQFQRLGELGCDCVQGLRVCEPLPAGQLAAWLVQQRVRAIDRATLPPVSPSPP